MSIYHDMRPSAINAWADDESISDWQRRARARPGVESGTVAKSQAYLSPRAMRAPRWNPRCKTWPSA